MARRDEFDGGWEQRLQRTTAMYEAADRGKFTLIDKPGCASGEGGKSCRADGFVCAGCEQENLTRFEGRR